MGMTTKKSRRLQRDPIEKTLLQSLVVFHYLSCQGASLADRLQDIHAARQARHVNLDLVVAFNAEALYVLANSVEEINLLDILAVDIHHVLDGIRIDAEQMLLRFIDACCGNHFDVKLIGACFPFKIGHDPEIECVAASDKKCFYHVIIEVRPVDSVC